MNILFKYREFTRKSFPEDKIIASANGVLDGWDNELSQMNRGKVGEPYNYPDSFIQLLGYMRAYVITVYVIIVIIVNLQRHE